MDIAADVRSGAAVVATGDRTRSTVYHRATFESFYERDYHAVVGLLTALTGNRSTAEDLAQDAFLATHRRWHHISCYDNPEAWVRRVATNLAISRFRRAAAEARALLRMRGERPVVESARNEFWDAVRGLPSHQAQVIALYYYEDRPVSDIAQILGRAEGTVRAQLHHARQSLAGRLQLNDGGES